MGIVGYRRALLLEKVFDGILETISESFLAEFLGSVQDDIAVEFRFEFVKSSDG